MVLQVATACESHIYSPINVWKTVCLEPDTSLYFWPLDWKTPKQLLYTKSHSEIIGELWADSSVGIFLHTCHAFNYEPLMSRWKTVIQPYSTLFTRVISRYTWGWPFSMKANVCASCHNAHALCQGNLLFCNTCRVQAIWLRHSVVGKHYVGSLNREVYISYWAFVFLLKLRQFYSVKCVQIASG